VIPPRGAHGTAVAPTTGKNGIGTGIKIACGTMATDGPCHGEGHEGICKPTGEALGNVCEDATVFWCIVERGGEVSMVDLFAFPAVSFASDDALLTDRLTSNLMSFGKQTNKDKSVPNNLSTDCFSQKIMKPNPRCFLAGDSLLAPWSLWNSCNHAFFTLPCLLNIEYNSF